MLAQQGLGVIAGFYPTYLYIWTITKGGIFFHFKKGRVLTHLSEKQNRAFCLLFIFFPASTPLSGFLMSMEKELERCEYDNHIGTESSSKRWKRHKFTEFQIQVLEAAFKESPSLYSEKRTDLGKKLGLEEKQVTSWFHKKRSLLKMAKRERYENSFLREEYNKLRIENMALKKEITCMICDNARLNNWMFLELALAGMDELMRLAQTDSPLWNRSSGKTGESLNLEEYKKTFPSPCVGEKLIHFKTEATRATATVMIDGRALVESLMDVNQWREMFPWNIRSASILGVISSATDPNLNFTLQLMQAELQILSPLVPVREMKFIRFCKQHGYDTWAVVDVSVDALFGYTIREENSNRAMSCRRLPSGCVVRDMRNGYSKVTWIEHTEYDDSIVHHLYRPLIRSGLAFGAQKWIANLQSKRVIMSSIASAGLSASVKTSITNLAQHMTRSFCAGVRFAVHKWEVVHDSDHTKVMITRDEGTAGNPGEPPRVILSATTTVRMPVSPMHLLEFLQTDMARCYWAFLSPGGPMRQFLCIPTAQPGDLGNCIGLFDTIAPENLLILQETCTDPSGSLIVHAVVEKATALHGGGDSSGVAILPSGFVIVPDCFPDSNGSLLTLGFQMLVNNLTAESVDTLKSFIADTIQGIGARIQ